MQADFFLLHAKSGAPCEYLADTLRMAAGFPDGPNPRNGKKKPLFCGFI